MAGFPGSMPGFWAFVDIQEGDFVSFLYGARVYDLYQVTGKLAGRASDPETESHPWKPLRFRSGREYTFPFRLFLRRVRWLEEPIARPEFAYVAENLLLRGGYYKTHIQADALTLGHVSQMGQVVEEDACVSRWEAPGWRTFTPRINVQDRRSFDRAPEVWPFRELLLQALVRRKLKTPEVLERLLRWFGLSAEWEWEALGEKALPQGYVDILIKPARPQGRNVYIPVEVKLGKAGPADLEQLEAYRRELGIESRPGILVAAEFSKRIADHARRTGIRLIRYSLNSRQNLASFDELMEGLSLEWSV